MKKFTFLVAFLLVSLVSFGQTAIQYGFSATAGTYTELAAPTVLASSTGDGLAASLDDINYRVTFPAGFAFNYLGTAQTDLNINTNGFVGFGSLIWTSSAGYTPLSSNPSGGTTSGIISAYGADLNAYSNVTSAPGSLGWQVEGAGDNEVFVVQYKNFKRYESSATVDRLLNIQIRFYESTHATKPNHIEIVYGNCVVGDTGDTGVDVGIRGGATPWAANVNSIMLDNVPAGSSCTWANPVTANNNTNGMYFNTANAAISIPNGLTYSYFPQGATAPNPVRTFAATTFDATTATLSWTAPTGATQYNIQYKTPGSCTWTNYANNPVNAATATITGLTPLTSYQIRVQASNGTVNSVWSHIPNVGGGGNGYGTGTFTTLATCVAPTAIVLSGSTVTSASFTWTASTSNPAAGYDYYLATVNTAPTATTTPTDVTNSAALTVNQLTANTTYYLFVRANCGGGDTSVWTSAFTFTTPCTATAIPYSMGFNAATAPSCWSTQLANTTQTATKISYVATSLYPTVAPQEGTHFVKYDAYSSGGGTAGSEERLISAPLATTGVNSVTVEFYWYHENNTTYSADAYLLEGATLEWSSNGGSTWTSSTFYPRHNGALAAGTGQWTFKTVTLPAGAGNQANLLVALRFHSSYGDNMYVDNFSVIATPSCSMPLAASFVSATDVSANISWTAPSAAPANGYEYYVGTTNAAPATGATATGSVAAGVTTAAISSLSPLTTYYVWVRSKCGASLFSDWAGPVMFGTLCDSGEVVSTTPGSVCGQGAATLQATANAGATLQWFATATGGSVLQAGASYTTPVITQTTTYYVSSGNTTQNLNIAIGAGGSTGGGLGVSPYSHGWGGVKSQFIITAGELAGAGISPGNLNSLGFTITSLGTPTLNNFAVSIAATTQNVATASHIDGLTPVYSNAAQTLTTGFNNYVFTSPFNWDGTSNIVVQVCYSNVNYGDTSSAVQYDAAGFVSTTYTYADNQPANAICATITGAVNQSGGTATSSSRPKITFNATGLCQSARVPVVATVTTPPVVTATASDADICAGESTTLTVTSANTGYTYTWMPGNLTGATQTVSPTADTVYTVTGFDSTSNCTVIATVSVNVNALPTAVTVSPAAPTVCEGTSQLLTAVGATASGNAVLGTTATAPGSTSWPNPFSAWYGGVKTQMLFKASELQAQGLVAGANITSLSFDFNAFIATGICNDLKIRIGNTTVANMTNGFVPSTGLTTVYNATYTPSATGLVPFALSAPFAWDGSDIIVEVIHNAGNSGNGAGNRTNASTTTFDSVYYGAKDGVSPAGVASLDAVAQADYSAKGATATRPNIVFAYNLQNSVVWSPATGLYTNADATTAYTGTNSATVYAKPAVNTTYTATVTNAAGCSVAANVSVVISSTPAPTAAATQTFCNGATVADLTATGTTIQWYAAATGGTALTATTALVNGSTYYAAQTVNGCQSLVRTPVAVTINVTAVPVAAAQTFCNAATVADLTATGTTIQWYAAATGGTALTAATALATGNYYASQTVNGCESPRVEVAVTVNVTVAPVAAAQTFCNAATVADLTATGTAVQWYAAATGGTALTANTALATGNYYASQTLNGCESAARAEVAVTVNVTAAPVAAAQTFCNAATVADLTATGTTIQWYAAATGGTALSADTALANGNYYASQTINGCESNQRAEVAVVINVTAAPTGEATQNIAVANTGDTATIEQIVVTAQGTVTWYASEADFIAGNALAEGTALVNGATYYAAQTVGDCTSATTLAVTVSIVLGNDKFNDKAFAFYPNPVKDILTVSYSNEISLISVVNMLGQEVISVKPNVIEAKVDMSGLADGTYIVTVRSNNTAKTIKVVKGNR